MCVITKHSPLFTMRTCFLFTRVRVFSYRYCVNVSFCMTGCLELKHSRFLSWMITWYRREHPTNQQVFSVVFQESFPAASSWYWSSLFTTAAACDGYLSFVFRHTHTHTHTHTLSDPRTFCTARALFTFAHVHTLEHALSFLPPPLLSCLFDNTTSSLTSSRSAPLSVLQRESSLWATRGNASRTF